jgi:hypothetical protein
MTQFRRYTIPKPDPANQKEKDLFYVLNELILDLDSIFNKSADFTSYDLRYLMLDAAHPMSSTDLVVNLNADLLDGVHASEFFTQAQGDLRYLGILATAANATYWNNKALPALDSGKFLTNNGATLSWGTTSVVLPDDETTKPADKQDGYASVVEIAGDGRIYFFVGSNRYYLTGILDNPVAGGTGQPIGMLLSLTYS